MTMQASSLSRRAFMLGAGAAGVGLVGCGSKASGQSLLESAREVVSVRDFGAVSRPGHDNTAAIQAAVNAIQSRGGGVVHIPETYECGNIVVSRDGVVFYGPGAWLVNGRITIQNGRQECGIEGLGIIDRRGDDRTFALDVGGRNCTFNDVSLVKDPIAGGYQMYLRPASAHCRFTGLRTKGSSGIFISGHDHLFSGFDLESKMNVRAGGDDCFALKAVSAETYNVVMENGVVRGYAAVLSIGSEVGTARTDSAHTAVVRNVTLRNVVADRCARLVFIKPGALSYDYRNGLVEDVTFSDLRLDDPTGFFFECGVMIRAGRGAIVRRVTGRNIVIRARSHSQGVFATSAAEIATMIDGAAARIEDVDLQLAFSDPFDGVARGPTTPGFPVDHVAIVKKLNPRHGSMSGIDLDIEGRGTRFGGIFVGAGLDGAVRIRRARLQRIGVNPPATVAGGGIWSDSRITVEDAQIDALGNRRFGGSAFPPGRE